ncbi:MAG: O-antigen ligase family protein [Chloroflexi bacterium]|nr:O-antigen ligase family protein [Chloroflexota bacterium]
MTVGETLRRRLQSWLVTGSKTQQLLATLILCLLVGIAGGALFAFLGPILAIALLATVAGGLLMLRSTQLTFFAIIGVICLLPFAALPVPNIGFSPTLLDLVLLVLLVNWLFQIARKKQKQMIGSALALPIVLFMVLACASFIIGLSFAPLTTNLLRHFVELLLSIFLFFVVINTVRSQKQLEQIITVLILAGFAASVIGIILYFLPQEWTIRLLSTLRILRYPSGSDVLRFVEDNPELPLRATSTSIDPNVLGGLLVIVAGVTVPQLLAHDPLPLFGRWLRWRGVNWLIVPILAAMLICLLLTFSRGAMAGLGVALFILALLRYRKLLVFILLASLLILLLPQTQWYVQRFLAGLRGEDLATQMRFGEYKDALILISRYPWFGVGFAGAPDVDTYIGVSCVYLLIAEEMGLVGLGMFLLIMALVISQILRALKKLADYPRLESMLLGLFTALVGALFTGIFDHYFFNLNFQHAVTLFWLCVGLSIAATLLTD